MKRVFILVPDLKETSDIAHELEAAGVKESDIHVCAHVNQEVRDADLHPANVFQKTHLGYAIKYGPILGACFVGLIFALCNFLLPDNIKIHALGYAAILFFGFGFGIWASGLVGLGVKDEVVEKYENFVSDGHYIMMIDTKAENVINITQQILSRHPGTSVAEQPAH
jgi:hypothetical protein